MSDMDKVKAVRGMLISEIFDKFQTSTPHDMGEMVDMWKDTFEIEKMIGGHTMKAGRDDDSEWNIEMIIQQVKMMWAHADADMKRHIKTELTNLMAVMNARD